MRLGGGEARPDRSGFAAKNDKIVNLLFELAGPPAEETVTATKS